MKDENISITSPDELDKHLRSSSPVTWIILFATIAAMLAFGVWSCVYELPIKLSGAATVENGETRMKRFLPLGITADERVCSGAHYARFFNDMRRLLEHPEQLECPPESVQFDEGNEYHLPKPAEQ